MGEASASALLGSITSAIRSQSPIVGTRVRCERAAAPHTHVTHLQTVVFIQVRFRAGHAHAHGAILTPSQVRSMLLERVRRYGGVAQLHEASVAMHTRLKAAGQLHRCERCSEQRAAAALAALKITLPPPAPPTPPPPKPLTRQCRDCGAPIVSGDCFACILRSIGSGVGAGGGAFNFRAEQAADARADRREKQLLREAVIRGEDLHDADSGDDESGGDDNPFALPVLKGEISSDED